ncbi:MAG: hypothetical protein UZ11_BCD004001627 [Bacteroidetes bacterium OLB11]|nr:MAG: hypothetical protein UZ11_BCD004001627 [Bacteroidetes bacterium OLB11]
MAKQKKSTLPKKNNIENTYKKKKQVLRKRQLR